MMLARDTRGVVAAQRTTTYHLLRAAMGVIAPEQRVSY